MAKFKVDTDQLSSVSNNMNKYSSDLSALSATVASFPIECDIDFSAAISSIVKNINYASNIMNISSRALKSVVEKHDAIQNKLRFEAKLTNTNVNNSQTISSAEQTKNRNLVSSNFNRVYSSTPTNNNLSSISVNNISTNENNLNNYVANMNNNLTSLNVSCDNQFSQLTNDDRFLLMAIVAAEVKDDSLENCISALNEILNKCESWKKTNYSSPLCEVVELKEFSSFQTGTYKQYLNGNVSSNVKMAIQMVLGSENN